MTYTLDQLNALSQDEFTQALGDIFEHTPAIARQAWPHRPFADVDALHRAMVAVVESLAMAEQVTLIQAHPDLGSKAAMADASVQEQASVGLNCLTPDEFDRFHRFNQAYKDRFGFPFIIAVRNHTKDSILAAFEERLTHSPDQEQQRAIAEICQIAAFRLQALISA